MTELLVSRKEARERIARQIAEGEEFLGDRGSPGLFERKKLWEDFTTHLLEVIFSGDVIELGHPDPFTGAMILSGEPTLGDRVEWLHDDVNRRLTHLRSLVKRLDLFPEPQEFDRQPTGQHSDLPGDTVFLVHGHDHGTKNRVARFLEQCDLNVTILHEQPNRGRTLIEKFEDYSDVGFAVVLLTPDDIGRSREDEVSEDRARQNVILELGFFLGKLGRERVCALKVGDVVEPSDITGVVYVPLDPNGPWKMDLAKELKSAGFAIDLNKLLP